MRNKVLLLHRNMSLLNSESSPKLPCMSQLSMLTESLSVPNGEMFIQGIHHNKGQILGYVITVYVKGVM